MNRLEKQIRFIAEIDKLKKTLRQTILLDRSRQENSAEHSWHLALMVMVLAEYAEAEIDCRRVMKMVLIHDLVEIDAGDTFCYDDTARQDQAEREARAADRIFNLLPRDQAEEFRSIWDEFEAGVTPESRFAAAVDRLQPVLHNYLTGGLQWRKHGVHSGQVISRNRRIEDGAPALWKYARSLIDDAVNRKYLESGNPAGR